MKYLQRLEEEKPICCDHMGHLKDAALVEVNLEQKDKATTLPLIQRVENRQTPRNGAEWSRGLRAGEIRGCYLVGINIRLRSMRKFKRTSVQPHAWS